MGQRYGQENVRHTGYTGSVGPKRNDPPLAANTFQLVLRVNSYFH